MSNRLRRRFAASALAVSLAVTTAMTHVGSAAAWPDRHADRSFQRLATFPVFQNSPDPTAVTVAEITAVSSNGQTLISTDSPGGRVTFTNIADPKNPKPDTTAGAVSALDVGGEPTSVAVYGEYALITVNTSIDFETPSGALLVISVADRSQQAHIELGGQPDSIALSPAGAVGGTYAAIAIENERDEDVNDGELPQPPAGFLVTIPLVGLPAAWVPTRVDLLSGLAGVAGIHAPEDPEPEYVTINGRNQAGVTLQENNAIVVIDLPTGKVLNAFSAGTVDLEGVDIAEDDTINLTGSLADVPREPDGIAWLGNDRLATANEGDLSGGSRGWSIFDAVSGTVVWDAGNTFEHLAVSVGLYPESRSENKGTEPESISVATYDGRRYAFVGSERGNFVAVYDLSNPAKPVFRQVLPVTNGPEGLLAIPSKGLFVVSSEVDVPEDDVRATISIFRLGKGEPRFPAIQSTVVDGAPIGWGALSALSADPRKPDRLWTVTDSYYSPTQLLSLSTGDRRHDNRPALIGSSRVLTENGAPLGLDAEGIFARPSGGFWLAAEGATGPENEILLLDGNAAVQRRIPLPVEVSAGLGSNGLEGITATGIGRTEQVYVALQRPLSSDPAGVARIGRYDVTSGAWSWYGYRLEAGSGVGLSELVALDSKTFAVIERDNKPGTGAASKRIYTFDIPRGPSTGLPILDKRLAKDLLPDLKAGNGWVQEKVEGLTIGRDGRVYLVTDNDGVEDATGETVFLSLGSRHKVFRG